MSLYVLIACIFISLRIFVLRLCLKREALCRYPFTAVFASIFITTMVRMPTEASVLEISELGVIGSNLYWIMIALLIIYIFLYIKMLIRIIRKKCLFSIHLFLDILIIVLSIVTGFWIMLTPILYYIYLSVPVCVYKLARIEHTYGKIRNLDNSK